MTKDQARRMAEEVLSDAEIDRCSPCGLDQWHLTFAKDVIAAALVKLVGGQEVVTIEAPDYHDQAMGCGLEDRGITDRYEAMRHGWDCAVERMLEQVPDEPLYTNPAPSLRVSGLGCRSKMSMDADASTTLEPSKPSSVKRTPDSR